jgi:AcrR family transcriptional regulator
MDAALDKAVRVFWKNGYEGTTLPDLTTAMGINRPSLYAAFGNKETLFLKAVDRYVDNSRGLLSESLEQPSARATVEHLLRGVIGKPDPDKIRGCLLVQGALACGDSTEFIRKELALRRDAIEVALRQRFKRALVENDLPSDAEPAALAKYVVTFQQGLAVQSASGANRDELLAAVELALRVWPSAETRATRIVAKSATIRQKVIKRTRSR